MKPRPLNKSIKKSRYQCQVCGHSIFRKDPFKRKNNRLGGCFFVMEKKHKQQIMEKLPAEAEQKEIIILDIPDEYQCMDAEWKI